MLGESKLEGPKGSYSGENSESAVWQMVLPALRRVARFPAGALLLPRLPLDIAIRTINHVNHIHHKSTIYTIDHTIIHTINHVNHSAYTFDCRSTAAGTLQRRRARRVVYGQLRRSGVIQGGLM